MDAEEIINQLKQGKPGQSGRVILDPPMTNIPVADSDYQAAKVIDYIMDEALPDGATLSDALVLIAEVQWWFVTFAALHDGKAFEPLPTKTE